MRRIVTVSFVFAMIAAASVLVSATPAGACTCDGSGTDAGNFERADAVFIAAVDRVHEARTGGSEGPEVVILRVSDVFKGDVDRLQGVATPDGEASCGFEFTPGVAYLVFTSTDTLVDLEDGFFGVDLCGGTRPLTEGAPAFDAAAVPPNDAGPPSAADIRAQLGDPRSSLFPEMLILAGVLAFVLGLAAWFSRKNRPAI